MNKREMRLFGSMSRAIEQELEGLGELFEKEHPWLFDLNLKPKIHKFPEEEQVIMIRLKRLLEKQVKLLNNESIINNPIDDIDFDF